MIFFFCYDPLSRLLLGLTMHFLSARSLQVRSIRSRLPSRHREPCTVDEKERKKAAMIIDGAWLLQSYLVENNGVPIEINDFEKIISNAEHFLPIRVDRAHSTFFNCDPDDFFQKVLKGDMTKIRLRDTINHFHEDIQEHMICFVPSKFKFKAVECRLCKNKFTIPVQKGTDMQIGVKMIEKASAENVEAILMVAGDGDFEAAMEFIHRKFNKPIYIIGYQKCISPDIVQYCKDIVYLDYLTSSSIKDNDQTIRTCSPLSSLPVIRDSIIRTPVRDPTIRERIPQIPLSPPLSGPTIQGCIPQIPLSPPLSGKDPAMQSPLLPYPVNFIIDDNAATSEKKEWFYPDLIDLG